MSHKKMEFLNNIEGLKYKVSEDDANKYDIEYRDITKDQIYSIINSIPNSSSISYWDMLHPTISDPGLYVTIQKYEDRYVYKLGNHGWSTKYRPIQRFQIIRYINKLKNRSETQLRINRRADTIEGMRNRLENDQIRRDQLNLLFSKNWEYRLFEVNGYYIISIIQGTVGIYEISTILSEQECELYEQIGNEYLETIYKELKCDSTGFDSRHIIKVLETTKS